MRRCKSDDNQARVVADLRAVGASVLVVSQFGIGFDLIVGFRGRNFLLEVKDGSKPKSARKLTTHEKDFASGWNGSVVVADNQDDAIRYILSHTA